MTIIDFLDYNVIDTLILVNTLRPDNLYLMADADELASKRASHLINAVKEICGGVEVETVTIDTRDMLSAVKAISDIAGKAGSEDAGKAAGKTDRKADEAVYLNIDADHGISTAASYGAAESSSVIPICVDMCCESIRNLKTLETIAEIKHIKLEDFLNAIGAKRLEGSHELPPEEEYQQIVNVAERLFHDVYVWNMLCTYIGKHYSHDSRKVRIPADLGGAASERNAETVRLQLETFCENGFLRKIDDTDDEYLFTSDRHKGYMVVFGIWLEMYIYIKMKPYLEEIHCGYVIDWESMDGFDTKDNEIDVIGISKSRPVLISCKMRMPTKEDIYEIGYIAEMLGGSQAIPVIATSSIVNHKQTYKPGLYPRFCKMNVGLLETIDIRTKPLDALVRKLGIYVDAN